MFESILQVLQWAVPGGIGATLAWLLSRDVRHAQSAKAVHDTYKSMYEDVSRSLTELRNENGKLYKAINRLERAVTRATACRHWLECPIRGELSEPEKRFGVKPVRQPRTGHRIRDTGVGDGGDSRGQRRSEGEPVDDVDPP